MLNIFCLLGDLISDFRIRRSYTFDPTRTAQYITLDASTTIAYAKIGWSWSATQATPWFNFMQNQTFSIQLENVNTSGLVFGIVSRNETVYGPSSVPGYPGNGGMGFSCNGQAHGGLYLFNNPGYCRPGDVLSFHVSPDLRVQLYYNNMFVGSGYWPHGYEGIPTVAMTAPSVVRIRNDLNV